MLSIQRDARIQRAERVQFSDTRTPAKHTQWGGTWLEFPNSCEADRKLIDDENEQATGQKLGVDDTDRQKLGPPSQGEGPERAQTHLFRRLFFVLRSLVVRQTYARPLRSSIIV